ncbi:MAG: Gfo/Idh/MocA family oxidoreductase [Ruminococcaceae bacterium]|nr:Gfo/Idh/MocA family oxidoreductase [Oscillospiraceae bacterium]
MVRIGIVGTGNMGAVHRSNYALIDDCQVVAVVGQSPQGKEKAKEWGLPVYDTISEMVQKEPVDLVDICTPTFLHKQQVMEALELEKHVLTEKPLALHKKDAEEMYRVAAEKGVQLYVAQVLQFTKETGILRNLVQRGEYGPALDAQFERLSACPRWSQGGWLFDREKSGLLPFDLHIHDLDLIVSLFGKPDDVSFTSCAGRGRGYQEHYRFQYSYKDRNVCAEAAWLHADIPFIARWRVYFENAMVIYDGTQVTAYPFDHEPVVLDAEDKIKTPAGKKVLSDGWYYRELSHFIECVEMGIPSPYVSREQVLTVLDILERISEKIEGENA